jgi:hypothetical protein
MYLQGLSGTQEQQETGQDPRGNTTTVTRSVGDEYRSLMVEKWQTTVDFIFFMVPCCQNLWLLKNQEDLRPKTQDDSVKNCNFEDLSVCKII